MISLLILTGVNTGLANPGGWAGELGRGNSGLADPLAMGTVLASPGVFGLLPRYELGAGYVFGPDQERRLQAGAVDSLTAPVTLGLVYQRSNMSSQATLSELPGWVDPDEDFVNPRSRSVLGAGFAGDWNDGRLGMGIGVFYDHEMSRFGGEQGRLDLSAGIATLQANQLTLALSAQHLIPYKERLEPFELGTGIHWSPIYGAGAELNLRAAFPADEGVDLSWCGGAFYTIAELVPVRLGFERDATDQEDRLWAGLGLVSDTMGIDYGFGMQLGREEDDPARIWNGLSLRVQL